MTNPDVAQPAVGFLRPIQELNLLESGSTPIEP